MVRTECMICHERPAFADDLPMCYECAETVVMADDVFPEETHATIKPIAYAIWDIIDNAITEMQIDEWERSLPERIEEEE